MSFYFRWSSVAEFGSHAFETQNLNQNSLSKQVVKKYPKNRINIRKTGDYFKGKLLENENVRKKK